MIERVIQPTATSCGQACLSMITGVPVGAVLRIIPEAPRGTYAHELAQFLRERNYHVQRLIRFTTHEALPDLAIIRMVREDRRLGHWIVAHRVQDCLRLLDPGPAPMDSAWRAASFMPIAGNT